MIYSTDKNNCISVLKKCGFLKHAHQVNINKFDKNIINLTHSYVFQTEANVFKLYIYIMYIIHPIRK